MRDWHGAVQHFVDLAANRFEAAGVASAPVAKATALMRREPIRVTSDPAIFEDHPDSYELWPPGSPIFPLPIDAVDPEDLVAHRAELAAIFRNLAE